MRAVQFPHVDGVHPFVQAVVRQPREHGLGAAPQRYRLLRDERPPEEPDLFDRDFVWPFWRFVLLTIRAATSFCRPL
jgi:hypothetical protein